MSEILILVIIGIVAGAVSGLVGIGGGVIIIPALVIILGLSQKLAQGTTLALMLPPISIFAVIEYHKKGFIDYKIVAFICLGFLIGSFFGGKFAMSIPSHILKKIFAVFILILSVKFLIDK